MKALVWTDIDRLEIQDVPRPEPKPGEVLLRVSHVGICGTDLHIRHGDHPRAKPPLIMGHELSGTVAEAGADVADWTPGDKAILYPVIGCGTCAVCRTHGEHICGSLGLYGIDWPGGMAEYVAVEARKLHRLPDDADLKRAALIEPVAVGLHALEICGFQPGATTAIIGAGPIGASVGVCALQAGAKEVVVSDISPYRLDVARQLGMTPVDAREQELADVVRAATNGEGARYVFEATGIPAAGANMLDAAAIAGTVVIVGVFPGAIPVDLRAVSFRELTLVGIRMYTPGEFDRAIELVCGGGIDVSPMITDVYPLDDGIAAFERTIAGSDNVKVLIRADG